MGKGSGFVYIVCGGQNVGKSKLVIEMTKGSDRRSFIYDHRREYLERFGKKNATIFYDRKQFISKIGSFYNSNIIIEEGTTFLSFQKEEDIADMVTGAFHNGNIIYLIFHSLSDCPDYLLRLSHVLILFKTGDDMIKTERNKPSLARHLHREDTPKFIKLQEF